MLTTANRDVFELQETSEQFLFQMKKIYVTSPNMEFGRAAILYMGLRGGANNIYWEAVIWRDQFTDQ